VVDVEEVALLHQHGPVQGREHHPQVGVAKMDPDQRSCSGCRTEGTAGRPPAPDALVPSSTSTSASIRSATSVETAEVDRPVTRATPARLHRGLDYTTATPACPLRLRSDSRRPVVTEASWWTQFVRIGTN
jgi:hypothetical protein